jgi:hypothetical protein
MLRKNHQENCETYTHNEQKYLGIEEKLGPHSLAEETGASIFFVFVSVGMCEIILSFLQSVAKKLKATQTPNLSGDGLHFSQKIGIGGMCTHITSKFCCKACGYQE